MFHFSSYLNPTDDAPAKIGQVIGDVIALAIYAGVAALMLYAALNGAGWW